MAFVELDFCPSIRASISAPSVRAFSGKAHDPRVFRVGAVAISLLIHSAILWWFVSRLDVSERPEENLGSAGGFLTVVDLAATSTPAASANAVSKEQAPSKPEIDLSDSTTLPVEWSMVSIKLPRSEPVSQSAPSAAAAVTTSGSVSIGAQAGSGNDGTGAGSGGYDPYAGAAPMRDAQSSYSAPPRPDPGGSSHLIETNFRELQSALLRKYPRTKGVIILTVNVSQAGIVTAVTKVDGNFRGLSLAALRQDFAGKQLFTVSARAPANYSRELPPMRFSAL